jgi:hypothetical protein
VIGGTVSPSAFAVVRLMNRKRSVGNQPMPELMPVTSSCSDIA